MSALFISVDNTVVNFENTFTYTVNASFSGIEGSISSAIVTNFLPSYISYTLPPISGLIKNITQTPGVLGTLITFDFGEILDLGVAIEYSISCSFNLGTDNQTTFMNTCDMYINGNLTETANSNDVTLSYIEDFVIEKSIAIPKDKNTTPGGRTIFTITLKNQLKSQGGNGDLGAKIEHVYISDLLPSGLSVDPNYPPKGNDISSNAYADNRYNNLIGNVDEQNNITFTLPDYYGTVYRIVVVCNVDINLAKETYLSNTATLSIDGTFRNSASDSIYIADPIYNSSISASGPTYCGLNNYISFNLSNSNSGNTDLLNFTIEDNIPNEVSIYRINTGSFVLDILGIPVPEDYTIDYEINNSGVFSLLGTYNTQTSEYVTLPSLSSNEKITKIRWNIPNFPTGIIQSQSIILDGVLTSSNQSSITANTAQVKSNTNDNLTFAQINHSVQIASISVLNINKSIVNSLKNVIPGQIIRYSISFNGDLSQIDNPVVADLLSNKLEYIGNELYTFYDYFNNQTINSNMDNFINTVSLNKQVINNFNNTGNVLLRYDFNGFSLRQKGAFTIQFDAQVKIGATGTIINNSTLGVKGTNSVIAPGQLEYLDVDDRDNDNNTNEYLAISYNTSTNILYYAGLSTNKFVKGELDSNYSKVPNIGLSFEGGSIDYKIKVTNIGNLNFNYIELIDILPHTNDTGVILTNVARKSQFNVYNVSHVSANIIENNTIVSNIYPGVEYSKSYNPLRFGQDNLGNSTIGLDNDWSTTLPNPISDTKSVKIVLSDNILSPNQSLVIDMNCLAPFGVSDNLVAWNSIAIKANYITQDNLSASLIPVEPNKVGIKIQKINKSSIGGVSWIDKNTNGLIDADEVGINGVKVLLFSSNNTLIKETLTIDNANNISGYYLFNNIDFGNYYIQFIKPSNLYFTLYNSATDNLADTNTGITPIITTSLSNSSMRNIDVGLVQYPDLILMLLSLINENIYSFECTSTENIVLSINSSTKILLDILTLIKNICSSELNNISLGDIGYQAQLQRLIYTLDATISKVNNLNLLPKTCDVNLLSNVLYTLSEYSLNLVSILCDKNGLNSYYKKCDILCNIYELLMGRLINNISNLENLNTYVNTLISFLYNYNANNHPQYIPNYTPKFIKR